MFDCNTCLKEEVYWCCDSCGERICSPQKTEDEELCQIYFFANKDDYLCEKCLKNKLSKEIVCQKYVLYVEK